MGSVTIPPVEQARTIFDQLGYTLSGEDLSAEFRAERGWKVVRVTAVVDPDETPAETDGDLRCFVTYRHAANALRRHLDRNNPDYEWAIITVGEGEEYDVVRAPPTLV